MANLTLGIKKVKISNSGNNETLTNLLRKQAILNSSMRGGWPSKFMSSSLLVQNILFRYAPHYGLNLHTSFGTNKSAVTFQSNCNVNEDGT